MKKVVLMLTMAGLLFSSLVQAQQEGKERPSREELSKMQAKRIADQLALDDATTEKFTTTFCNYQQEIWALNPRPERGEKPEMDEQQPEEKPEITEEVASKMLQEQFERNQKILDIRKKYYEEYSKFLTQKQILKVYEQEREMIQRIGEHRHGQGKAPHNQRPQAPRN